MGRILNKHHLLLDNQYYHRKTRKTRIALHHDSGRTAQKSIDWWNLKPDHVSTPYIIPRNGEIWELFNPIFWAYALGINSMWAERKTIHIEIASGGGLNKINGKFYTWFGKEVPKSKVVTYKEKHRGYYHFEKYTDAQVDAVIFLIDFLSKKFDIEINDVEKFWWFDKDSNKSLISHTTVRKDKSDIHPQPNLIKAIYNYAGCTAPITE
jgi:N-acetyl-anhydromuramyl-L-alanine amidase AmpD